MKRLLLITIVLLFIIGCSPSKVDVPEGDISSDDCLSQGGKIVDVDLEDNTSCPDDRGAGSSWP